MSHYKDGGNKKGQSVTVLCNLLLTVKFPSQKVNLR